MLGYRYEVQGRTREGGLFVIVSNLITVLKYVMLLFLPLAFAGLPNIDFGFPGIDIASDLILYCYMYCKLNQLYLGCSCRNVCTGMALQYRNNRAERRSVDGGILLRE